MRPALSRFQITSRCLTHRLATHLRHSARSRCLLLSWCPLKILINRMIWWSEFSWRCLILRHNLTGYMADCCTSLCCMSSFYSLWVCLLSTCNDGIKLETTATIKVSCRLYRPLHRFRNGSVDIYIWKVQASVPRVVIAGQPANHPTLQSSSLPSIYTDSTLSSLLLIGSQEIGCLVGTFRICDTQRSFKLNAKTGE